MNPGKFVEGLLLGIGTGIAAGLLLAPKPGQEVQSDVRDRLSLVLDEGRRAAAERRAELESQFAQARQVRPTGGR